jgi:hypothetical protein
MGKTIADLELEANALFEFWLLATPRSLRDRIPGFEPSLAGKRPTRSWPRSG